MTNTIIVIEGVVIVLLLVLVAGLLRSHAEILRQLGRLGINENDSFDSPGPLSVGFREVPIDSISGIDLRGSTRTVSLRNGRTPTLLAFLSSGCSSCRGFWKTLHTDVDLPLEGTRLVIVTKGAQSESPAKLDELAPTTRTLIMSDEAWDLFQVPVTPYFLLADAGGQVIGEGSASTWDQLVSLLRQSVADSVRPTRLDTEGRDRFTDSRLRTAGIRPGDPSLYRNPTDHD